jgi:hypothetical protein
MDPLEHITISESTEEDPPIIKIEEVNGKLELSLLVSEEELDEEALNFYKYLKNRIRQRSL